MEQLIKDPGTVWQEIEEWWNTQVRAPQQKQPEVGNYTFPTDIATIPDERLANLQLRIGGWYSYYLVEQGRLEAKLHVYRHQFENIVNEKMLGLIPTMQQELGTRQITKDMLRTRAFQEDSRLKMMDAYVANMEAQLKLLTRQVESYENQVTRFSREQSRRDAAKRIAGVMA